MLNSARGADVQGTSEGPMKKIAWASLLIAVLMVGFMAPSSAWAWSRHFSHTRSHVFISVGPGFWWGHPYPYYWYYPPYYYPPAYYVYTPPPVVVQEPPVYVQQPVPAAPAPPAPPAQSFWYYCSSAQAYYPSVQSCPEAWIKVAPRSQ